METFRLMFMKNIQNNHLKNQNNQNSNVHYFFGTFYGSIFFPKIFCNLFSENWRYSCFFIKINVNKIGEIVDYSFKKSLYPLSLLFVLYLISKVSCLHNYLFITLLFLLFSFFIVLYFYISLVKKKIYESVFLLMTSGVIHKNKDFNTIILSKEALIFQKNLFSLNNKKEAEVLILFYINTYIDEKMVRFRFLCNILDVFGLILFACNLVFIIKHMYLSLLLI
jgi:hypothetical protein